MHLTKAIIVLMALVVSVICLSAQEFDWAWAVGGGSSTSDNANDLVSDSQGNLYVTGHYSDTAQFGPFTLTNAGASDIFVAKLSPAGNWLWAIRAGDYSLDVGSSIALDNAGNILFAGTFTGTVSFGATTLTASAYDILVAKLDANGNWLWAKKAGGNGYDGGNGVAADANGNVYLAGHFWGTAQFGATTLTSAGSDDGVVAKLSSSGNWLWARQIASIGDDTVASVSTGSSGQVLACGSFQETCSFGPTDITSLGETDAFVTNLDASGNWVWTRRIGSTGDDYGTDVTSDSAGNVYLVGGFEGTLVINGETFSSHGGLDALVAKLNSAGTWLWARGAGGNEIDEAMDIAAEGDGSEIYITGFFRVAAFFGPNLFESQGNSDIFVAGLDGGGNWLWARQAGGFYSSDGGYAVTLNNSGVLCVCGNFNVLAQFGDLSLSGFGSNDPFIAKLDWLVPAAPTGLDIQMASDDAHLIWTPVTSTPEGYAFQPDLYLIYYNTAHDSDGPYLYLDFTPAAVCHYVHQFVSAFARDQFYRVTAVKLPGRDVNFPEDRENLRAWLESNLRPGMSEAEVQAVLQGWR